MMLALAWWTYSLLQYNNHFEKREKKYAQQEFRISQLWLDSLLNGIDTSNEINHLVTIKWNEKYFTINEKKLSEISNKLNKNFDQFLS